MLFHVSLQRSERTLNRLWLPQDRDKRSSTLSLLPSPDDPDTLVRFGASKEQVLEWIRIAVAFFSSVMHVCANQRRCSRAISPPGLHRLNPRDKLDEVVRRVAPPGPTTSFLFSLYAVRKPVTSRPLLTLTHVSSTYSCSKHVFLFQASFQRLAPTAVPGTPSILLPK